MLVYEEDRIIPANTGRIYAAALPCLARRDHPREYGENKQRWVSCQTIPGSSPRIRREFIRQHNTNAPRRIIPANTGRIYLYEEAQNACTDHPREYGENMQLTSWCHAMVGSSPRIRGESRILSRTSP